MFKFYSNEIPVQGDDRKESFRRGEIMSETGLKDSKNTQSVIRTTVAIMYALLPVILAIVWVVFVCIAIYSIGCGSLWFFSGGSLSCYPSN